MAQYYKRKTDGKTPTLKDDLKNLLRKWKCEGRDSPVCSPNVSESENVDNDEEELSDDSENELECHETCAV